MTLFLGVLILITLVMFLSDSCIHKFSVSLLISIPWPAASYNFLKASTDRSTSFLSPLILRLLPF